MVRYNGVLLIKYILSKLVTPTQYYIYHSQFNISGYLDNGEVWREEIEIQNLEIIVEQLYAELKPLYMMLHSVVRYKLYQKYGPSVIDLKGPIPVHLLGKSLKKLP